MSRLLDPNVTEEDAALEQTISPPIVTVDEPEPKVKANIPLPEPLQEDESFAQAMVKDYDLIDDLIREFPIDLGHLAGIPIKLLLKRKKWVSKGQQVIYKAKAFPVKDSFVHSYRFLIEINESWWLANEDKRRPMMFEALYSCDRNDDDKCSIRPHDFSGFYAALQHFGPWDDGLSDMAEQLDMFKG